MESSYAAASVVGRLSELDGFGSASAFVIMPPHRVRVIVAALQDELVNVFVQSEPIRTKAVTHSLVRPPGHACPGEATFAMR
jgi:hypothetical protein